MKTPTWTEESNEIGSRIADEFYPTTSIFHAELRRLIIRAIESEREVTRYYINQMGRWVAESKKPKLAQKPLDTGVEIGYTIEDAREGVTNGE